MTAGRFRPAVRSALYTQSLRMCGAEHPWTRARFGRMVASKGYHLSANGSGLEAWVANYRELGHAGFRNRAYRKAEARRVQAAREQNPGETPCIWYYNPAY